MRSHAGARARTDYCIGRDATQACEPRGTRQTHSARAAAQPHSTNGCVASLDADRPDPTVRSAPCGWVAGAPSIRLGAAVTAHAGIGLAAMNMIRFDSRQVLQRSGYMPHPHRATAGGTFRVVTILRSHALQERGDAVAVDRLGVGLEDVQPLLVSRWLDHESEAALGGVTHRQDARALDTQLALGLGVRLGALLVLVPEKLAVAREHEVATLEAAARGIDTTLSGVGRRRPACCTLRRADSSGVRLTRCRRRRACRASRATARWGRRPRP
eukprot:7387037-Prymnesium_polylepis.1